MDISRKLYDAGDDAALQASHDKENISKDIQIILNNEKCSERQLAEFFGVGDSTIRRWRRRECPADYSILRQIHYTAQKLSESH
jgi:DNA-binding transcriptional regulator YiaG